MLKARSQISPKLEPTFQGFLEIINTIIEETIEPQGSESHRCHVRLLLGKDQYILQKSTDLRALIYALAHKLTLAPGVAAAIRCPLVRNLYIFSGRAILLCQLQQ